MTPTNLYQYYTSQGQALPSVSDRTGIATKAGITGTYTGTADQNTQLLSYLLKSGSTTNNVVSNQTGIMQTTTGLNSTDAATGTKIDAAVQNKYPVPVYGSDVKDANGNVIGTAKFDPNSGQPLQDPTQDSTLVAPDGKKLSTTAPEGYDYSLPSLDGAGAYLYSSDGHVYRQDEKGNIALDPTGEAEYNKTKEYNDKIRARDELYDNAKKGMDAAHSALIDSIKQVAKANEAKMAELNKRTLGAKTVQQYRTGGPSAEYTPEIATGIIKKEEEEGMARISEIESNMQLALAQAVAAKTSQDFEMAKAKLDEVDKLAQDKMDAVQAVYKNYVDNQKYLDDKLKAMGTEDRAQKDQAMQELTTAAPNLVENYDKLKTTADKNAYIAAIAKRTGLDTSVILGEMDKNRLSIQKDKLAMANTRSEMAKRASTDPGTDTNRSQKNYDEKTIPSDIKKLILDDIAKVKGLTISQLYNAYPEVNTTYLDKLFNSLGEVQ